MKSVKESIINKDVNNLKEDKVGLNGMDDKIKSVNKCIIITPKEVDNKNITCDYHV